MEPLSRTDLIMHPIRLRILGAAANRQLTVQQIMKALPDISQASIYRHIRLLTDTGLMRVVEERPVRGLMERVYTVVAEETTLQAKQLDTFTREDMIRYFEMFINSVISQFRLYSRAEDADPLADGIGFWGDTALLNPVERNELVESIQTLVRRYRDNAATPDRLRFHICHELIPDKAQLNAEADE